MNSLFLDLCRTLELAVREACFGNNAIEPVQPQSSIPVGSLYVSVQDDVLYKKLKKHVRTYLFREALLNNRKLRIIVEHQSPAVGMARPCPSLYDGHFPPYEGEMYIDFVYEDEVNAHIASLSKHI